MTKAEEIAKKYATDKREEMDGLRGYDILLDDTIERTIATAINEAMEWAAQRCESEAKHCRKNWESKQGDAARRWDWAATTAEMLTEEIRKGKSQ